MTYFRAIPETWSNTPWGGFGQSNNLNQQNLNLDPQDLPIGGSGTLTETQQKLCKLAQSKLVNMPWVTSPDCGICAPCPPPEALECPSPEAQGYILPGSCPTCDSMSKTEAELSTGVEETSGIAWWWLLVAAATAGGLGYALGAKKLV
jgi:hypothetical protein